MVHTRLHLLRLGLIEFSPQLSAEVVVFIHRVPVVFPVNRVGKTHLAALPIYE